MSRLRTCVAMLVLMTGAAGVRAHHSFAALFDASRTVTVDGVVARFEFIAPHSYIQVDAVDASGALAAWEVETTSPGQLIRAGLTPESLHPGDRVRAVGNPARDGRRLMRLRTITLPSGEEKRIQ